MAEYDNLLAKIEKLDANAMPGPWVVERIVSDDHDENNTSDIIREGGDPDGRLDIDIASNVVNDDADFIAQARTLLPEAAAALRALQTENTELREKAEQALNMKLSLDLEDGGWYGGVSVRDVINRSERAEHKRLAAERAITEALNVTPLGGSVANLRGVVDEMRFHLSSYPLGEGQTQQGDER